MQLLVVILYLRVLPPGAKIRIYKRYIHVLEVSFLSPVCYNDESDPVIVPHGDFYRISFLHMSAETCINGQIKSALSWCLDMHLVSNVYQRGVTGTHISVIHTRRFL